MQNLAEPSEQGKALRKPLRNLRATFAEPCGTCTVREILKEIIAEPSRNFRGTLQNLPSKGKLQENHYGTFAQLSRNLAEPSERGRALRKPLRNLAEPPVTFAEPYGTFPASQIRKKTIAEPCGTSRNLRGTLKANLKGNLKELAELTRNSQPATRNFAAEPGSGYQEPISSREVRTKRQALFR